MPEMEANPMAETPLALPSTLLNNTNPGLEEKNPFDAASSVSSSSTLLPSFSDSSRQSSVIGRSSLNTNSTTREQLRITEARLAELQLGLDNERGINARLRQEARLSHKPYPMRSQLSIHQLRQDLRTAGIESKRTPTKGLFKEACSTDLVFLIDTTGSMHGSINAAKEQVRNIVAKIKDTFANEADVRIAVVGYKDHGESPHIQYLDFTDSADQVRNFVSTLSAIGGGDQAEDVLGGLNQALNLSWAQQTRCIIHIGDAPPHGTIHHTFGIMGDDYKDRAEPHGLLWESLLERMISLNINYAFLGINNTTDRMVFNFFKKYLEAGADCQLLRSNRYHGDASDLSRTNSSISWRDSRRSARAKLLFEEAYLGTAYESLLHLVVRVVSSSSSRTAVRLSGSSTSTTKQSMMKKKLVNGLKNISEDGDDEEQDKFSLETTPPTWDVMDFFNETLMVEGFSPDVVVHNSKTLNSMLLDSDNIKLSLTELTIHKRSRPFAQGAMRTASYARTAASTDRFVVKSYLKSGKQLAHFAEDMQCQALCKAFALEFNSFVQAAKAVDATSGEDRSLDFIVTTCLKGRSEEGSDDECMSLEPFIDGTYVKYNNNCGYVNRHDLGWFNDMAQAFSHFTFERSKGRFLVCDLQGVGHVLTDPAIHTSEPDRFRLADTNLGPEGFKFFFATHTCNSVCTKLGLRTNINMFKDNIFDFKTNWPTMSSTVCCSNKLCGKIISLSKAKSSKDYPSCHWCDRCWPQLENTQVKRLCISEEKPDHQFKVSEFFWESQGRAVPRLCYVHRADEDDLERARRTMTINKRILLGGGLWSRLKIAKKSRT